nr:MAG TPA: hypothetical protein [Caudoviricetes sp.]DAZ53696.1 MAG TPA: hypothetical protein [Caudoviricetes sp.]
MQTSGFPVFLFARLILMRKLLTIRFQKDF